MSASARRPIKRGILLGMRYGRSDADHCLAADEEAGCLKRGLVAQRRCAARRQAHASELLCSVCPLAHAGCGQE